MAQAEDTELRDLVMETMEKNGSLAKIKAALRANIFKIFESDGANKSNEKFQEICDTNEAKLAFSLIDDFLESCGLRHTLFVFRGEISQKCLMPRAELKKKMFPNVDCSENQPVLTTLIKNLPNIQHAKAASGDFCENSKNRKEDDNCTYIVHDDVLSPVNSAVSHSDNSIEDKNKLLLHLQLENSDTDSSTDSRDKSSSEYIPSDHIQPIQNVQSDENSEHFPKSSFFAHLNLKQLGLSEDSSAHSEGKADDNNTSIDSDSHSKNSSNTINESVNTEEISVIKQNDSSYNNSSKGSHMSSPAPELHASVYKEIMKDLDYSNDFTNETQDGSPKLNSIREDIQSLSLKEESSTSEISEQIPNETTSESAEPASIAISVIKENITYHEKEKDSAKNNSLNTEKDSSISSIPSLSNIS